MDETEQIEIITTNVKDLANISSTTKDNGNIVIGLKGSEKYIQLPFNKKDKYFMNPVDFTKFIRATEGMIRKSTEYSRYIAYLKNEVGLRSCALFKDINDDIAPIEMHHYIFNLYDIIEIQIAHLYKNGERINSANVAHHVLKDHFENIIQIVPLCEMAHKGWHAFQKLKSKDNSKFFISMESCFGDLNKFLEKYHDSLTVHHVMKLKRYLKDYEEFGKNIDKPEIFNENITKWSDMFKM